ncbi:uncharacterized protein G2W53_028336 [Senna tora]|uniref:Uncharacterized protein n=1 Tax=Senna tora TaxID=362788 RepID=A0A834T5U9_9FABA|nr:uncharacterized protein G2W53_028336 [Senna tora]
MGDGPCKERRQEVKKQYTQ